MHQHYFIKAFAVDGTNTPNIPNAADPSGYVSWAEGWTFDYQRNLLTDPAAKSPTYVNFNNFGYAITLALKDYQETGSPEFITSSDNGGSAFSYRIGAIIRYSGSGNAPFGLYLNTLDNNTNTPGGTGWIDLLAAVATKGIQTVTTSGNFTVPAGIKSIDVEIWGGGGGGDGGDGGAGGGGGYARKIIAVTPGQVIAVTIGAGGTGAVSPADGTDGGTTSFAAYFNATGGVGVVSGASGGVGGVGVGGDLNLTGGTGGDCNPSSPTGPFSANGGNGANGGSGGVADPSVAAGPGIVPGGGGSANGSAIHIGQGANGAAGLCVVRWG